MSSERIESKDIESAYIESTLLGIQELRNNLVTQIAHNFRTPLTSVIGFAEMLLDDGPLTDEQRVEYARFIHYEGIRLSKLIDDVLELSSLERSDTQLKLEDHVLPEVVAEAVARVSEFARGRHVTVKNCAWPPIVVRLDRSKMSQAIFQLLHNAVRFTRPHDEVEVTVRVIGEAAEIGVRDGGPGIPAEEIPTLFESIASTLKPGQDNHSTGVGLTIVKHIVDLHQGRILVDSTVGKGSLFTLQIPGVLE